MWWYVIIPYKRNRSKLSTADKRECQLYKEIKTKLLSDIAADGLKIGNRWIVRQESTFFVIRDLVGSQTKDSRIAFPANSYLNPTWFFVKLLVLCHSFFQY